MLKYLKKSIDVKIVYNKKKFYLYSSYYDLLDVKTNANLKEIREAYLIKVKRYHPDKNKLFEAEEHFKKIQNAYETLRDEKKRAIYDEFISFNSENEKINSKKNENEKTYEEFSQNYSYKSEKWNYSKTNEEFDHNFYFYKNFYNKKEKKDNIYSKYEQKIINEEKIYNIKAYLNLYFIFSSIINYFFFCFYYLIYV